MSLLNFVLAIKRVEDQIDLLPEGEIKKAFSKALYSEIDYSTYKVLLNGHIVPCDPEYVIEVYLMLLGRIKRGETLLIMNGDEIVESHDRISYILDVFREVYHG